MDAAGGMARHSSIYGLKRSSVMSAATKVKNSLQRLMGRSKRTAGRVSGDRSMEARGAAQKSGGDVRQAGENLKDAVR
jgi:uncharacterized protein YjbJ (UPF0337 family)